MSKLTCPYCQLPAPTGRYFHMYCKSAMKRHKKNQDERNEQLRIGYHVGHAFVRAFFRGIAND